MDLSTDIVLDDADGSDVTFRRVASLPNGSDWIDIATNLTEPGRMKILHSVNGKGVDTVDRHLIQMARTKIDTAGVPRTLTLNFTLSVPRSTAVTSQIVYDAVANMLDLLSDGALTTALADTDAVAQLLRGES
jgi:hypothetical protein